MTVSEIEREQDKLMPHEDLTPYEGQWVALRDGHVVASDLDPVALRNKDEVSDADVITLVPAAKDGIFIL